MANQEQLEILKQGVKVWNKWREENPDEIIDLTGANLYDANIPKINFRNAYLGHAVLSNANLEGADLISADLIGVNFYKTRLKKAKMQNARLVVSRLVKTDLEGANLNGCTVYGASVWNTKLTGSKQDNLIISQLNEPVITIDNLKVAQFIYLMLNNEEIRDVLGTIAKKGVLILGRFTTERKKILDAIRDKLRLLDFVPMMFDFEKVSSKDFTETIKILAGLSRFVIADISNPSSSPLELQATLPDYKIPFVPIIEKGQRPFAMFQDLTIYPWCLDVIGYKSEENLIQHFQKGIIDRALKKEQELLDIKGQSKKPLQNIEDL